MTFWLKVQMLYHMSYRRLVGVKAECKQKLKNM